MARTIARPPRAGAAALPEWIAPQLTQLVDAAPEGDAWLHEIKYDGYRMHARGRAREAAGNQKPWPADKVERWPIERLIPYAKNGREYTPHRCGSCQSRDRPAAARSANRLSAPVGWAPSSVITQSSVSCGLIH